MKLTPWYPGEIKPVREGVYQRLYPYLSKKEGAIVYCYYEDEKWKSAALSAEKASLSQNKEFASLYQNYNWRGLSEQPN
jgi:hypothetical protein